MTWPSRPPTTAPTSSSTGWASATWSWPVAPTTIATWSLAAERLDNVPPDQRGWEWRYLKQQTRGGLFTLYGHTGPVTSVSFSPDGTRIVTGSRDRTAKVWDARTGTALLELKGHMGRVIGAAFSPDGTRIVTGSDDETAKVWDARTGDGPARTRTATRAGWRACRSARAESKSSIGAGDSCGDGDNGDMSDAQSGGDPRQVWRSPLNWTNGDERSGQPQRPTS